MWFLHISDIHFKAPECLSPDTDPDRGVRTRLERHLTAQVAKIGGVDAILVGGDVAFAGDPREYGEARKWLDKLRSIAGCEKGPLLVVPGNHDIDRISVGRAMSTRNVHKAIAEEKDEWRESTLRAQLADPHTAAALLHGHAAYNDFAAPLQCQIYADRLYWKQDLDLTSKVKLRIHGLTSTLLSGRDGKNDPKPSLYVSPLQTALDPVPDVVNMVMCHHPFDWLIDGDDVENALDRRATFQLFGHKHKQKVQREADYVRWGAGAVNPSRSEKQYEPGYNLVRIDLTGTGGGQAAFDRDPPVHVSIQSGRIQTDPDVVGRRHIPAHHPLSRRHRRNDRHFAGERSVNPTVAVQFLPIAMRWGPAVR